MDKLEICLGMVNKTVLSKRVGFHQKVISYKRPDNLLEESQLINAIKSSTAADHGGMLTWNL